ncbi:MAG: SGNH/GDSL hydrolase family protein [Candidatus Saccharimonadales bacterium]
MAIPYGQPALAAADITSLADPLTAQSIYINDSSCPSSNFCMAVGNFTSDSNHGQALILTNTSQGWQHSTTQQPQAAFDRAQLNTVACSSATFCLAFGNYLSNQSGWSNWTIVWNGLSWQQLSLSGMDGVTINDVACPADQNCWAVGTAEMPGGAYTRARLYHYNQNNWSEPTDEVANNAGSLSAISCLDSTHCWSVGRTLTPANQHFLLVSQIGDSWTVDTTYDVNDTGNFMAIDCSVEQVCTILGNNIRTGGRVLARRANNRWATIDLSKIGSGVSGDVWQSVGCFQQDCFLAGQTAPQGSDNASIHAVIDRSSDNIWQSSHVEPATAAAQTGIHMPTSNLTGMTCFDTGCLAYGNYQSNGQMHIYVASFDGQKWLTQDPLQPVISEMKAETPIDTSNKSSSTSSPLSYVAAPNRLDRKLAYVAFGDSITTGNSIPGCQESRQESPWGCTNSPPPATPYPDLVAANLGYRFSDQLDDYSSLSSGLGSQSLERVGIWGDTLQDVTQARRDRHNNQGLWSPQLVEVEHANKLVTGSLGINDLHFSDIAYWIKQYLTPGGSKVSQSAQQILSSRSADFDQLFRSLVIAKGNGAKVAVTLYYNPYDSAGYQCQDLKNLASQLIDSLDQELLSRSRQAGLMAVDFRPTFQGHGAGSPQPYVFGSQCKLSSAVADWMPSWLGGGGGQTNLAAGFDPHPNNSGTSAMAQAILGVVKS